MSVTDPAAGIPGIMVPLSRLMHRNPDLACWPIILLYQTRDEFSFKLQRLLDRRIRNEMQVVYLMVELRKLMDRENYKDPYCGLSVIG
jgi:hypothetical protein